MDTRTRWDESNRALVEIIRERIAREGRITFADFFAMALYHPEHGYYTSGAARPGRSGDFITAPEAHPIFGHVIARQLSEMWQRLGHPHPFTLREYGPGSGALAQAILAGLAADGDGLLEAIRYEPVEISAERHADLERRLSEAGFGEHVAAPVRGQRITGCVLANEFVDAFPVHRLLQQGGALREVYVTWRDGWFADEIGPLSTPEIAERLAREGITLAEGQRAEISLGAPGWIAEVAASLERGYALVIDYGYLADELFSQERFGGTLKAYYRHTVHEDPYRAVGEQDLTAHVDFTALWQAAEDHGLQVLGLTTQASFLAGAGIGELLLEMQQRPGITAAEYLAARAAVMRMIDPGAMGRFRVLILGRDVPVEPPLRGLSVSL